MPFLMSPTIIAVLVALVLQALTLGWGTVQSHRAATLREKLDACSAAHVSFVKQVDAQGQIAREKARATEETNRRTADETAKGWASALDVVRVDATRRLRLTPTNPGGSGVPAPPGPGQPAAATNPDAIPAPARVAADCAETTLTANFLQRYVENLK